MSTCNLGASSLTGPCQVDRHHPRFGEYRQFRKTQALQLVQCPSFGEWLQEQEFLKLAAAANRHARIGDYREWLCQHVHVTPPAAQYVDFWTWLRQSAEKEPSSLNRA